MAISDTQKVDYLFKKIGFGISKTDTATVKSPSNETIASPLILRGDIIWQQGESIPAVQPGASAGVVTVYSDATANTVECTADSTSTLYRTWKTNLIDWISPEYGATYQVKVYLDSPGAASPQTTGTRIFPDGTGNNDEWYFDYASGVLNFIGANLPSLTFSGKKIYVVGARYTGQKGLVNFPGGMTIGNINLNGNSIGIVNTDGNLNVSANGAGYVTLSNTIASSLQVTNNSNFYSNLSIDGNLNVTGNTVLGGNLTVNGDIVGFTANTITMFDSLLYIASENTTSDLVDIGLVGHYNDGVTSAHTGVIRDAGTKEFYFFDGYTAEPSTNDININDLSFSLANLNVSNLKLGSTTTIGSAEITASIPYNIRTGNDVINLYSTSALLLPSGNTDQRPVTTVAGQIRYNEDTGVIEYWTGVDWLGLVNGVEIQIINGDGINNTFTLDKTTTSIGMLVTINGTLQQPDVAYTVSGNQITFAEVPLVTDTIDVRYIATLVTNIELWANAAVQADQINLINSNVSTLVSTINSNVSAANTAIANITNGTTTFGNIIPSANVTYSLGTSSNRWKDLWISGSTIHIGDSSISLVDGNVVLGGSSTLATKAYVDTGITTAVSNLLDSAPTALNTLNELATALNNDASFATSTATAIGLRANIASPAFTGTPTAPTANVTVDNTQIATTGFVHDMLPTGIITMWYGQTTNVPYGWYLCDGTNGTPDLRDRFVVGAGSTYAVGVTGGSKDAIVVSHSHTATSTVSDPGHYHSSTLYDINDHNQGGGYYDGAEANADDQQGTFSFNTDSKTTGITVSTTVNSTGSSGTNANMPPYYALCYIMKA